MLLQQITCGNTKTFLTCFGLSVGTLRGVNYGHSISFSNTITKLIYSYRITSIYYKWFLMVEYGL